MAVRTVKNKKSPHQLHGGGFQVNRHHHRHVTTTTTRTTAATKFKNISQRIMKQCCCCVCIRDNGENIRTLPDLYVLVFHCCNVTADVHESDSYPNIGSSCRAVKYLRIVIGKFHPIRRRQKHVRHPERFTLEHSSELQKPRLSAGRRISAHHLPNLHTYRNG